MRIAYSSASIRYRSGELAATQMSTNEMLIERGIREAALFGNVADAGRCQTAFAEDR